MTTNRLQQMQQIAKLAPGRMPTVYWIVTAFVTGFLLIAPFYTALFNGNLPQFDGPIFSGIIWSMIALIVAVIPLFRMWHGRELRDWLVAAIWLVPFCYLISHFNAASPHFSANMLLIMTSCTAFYMFGAYLSQEKIGAAVIQHMVVGAGYVVVIYGFLNMFGNAYFTDAVMLTGDGLRLTSVFQYPNAYAAFLMAILFSCLYYVVQSRKWYAILLHGIMLIPIMSSIWLTQSRGGYLLIPIVLIVILPFVGLFRQVFMALYLGITAVVSLMLTEKFIAIAEPLTRKYSEEYAASRQIADKLSLFASESFSGWGRLFAFSLGIALLVLVLQRFVVPYLELKWSGVNRRKLVSFLFPILLIILGSIAAWLLLTDSGADKLLPETIQKRVENINLQQHSLLERQDFYRDAFRVFQDHPLIGAGGGAWAALWEKYQSHPYISRQAHSFPMQFLVETGLLGFVLLLVLLFVIYSLYIRHLFKQEDRQRQSHFIFFIVSISILLHSLIDFEMSFVYLASVVFLCWGGLTAAIPNDKWFSRKSSPQPSSAEQQVAAATATSASAKSAKSQKAKSAPRAKQQAALRSWRFVFPVVVGIAAIVALFTAVSSSQANRNYYKAIKAINTQDTFQNMLNPLNAALKSRPNNPDYLLLKINLMDQAYKQIKDNKYKQESLALTERLKQKETYNRGLYEYEYSHLMESNQPEQALAVMIEAASLFPWDGPSSDPSEPRQSFYERAFQLLASLSAKARSDKNETLLKQYYDQALSLYNNIVEREREMQSLPEGQLPIRPFAVTQNIALFVGELHYYQEQYAEAEHILIKAVNQELATPNDRQAARFYLAALQKQGKNDQTLYDKLIASDSNEKAALETLLSL